MLPAHATHVDAATRTGWFVAHDARFAPLFSLNTFLDGATTRDVLLGHVPALPGFFVQGVELEHVRRQLARTGHVRVESPQVLRYDGMTLQVVNDVEEELAGAAFTVDGMAYSLQQGVLLDPVGGHGDLVRRAVYTIGRAAHRLAQAPLRALQALRLAARFAMTLGDDLHDALPGAFSLLHTTDSDETGAWNYRIPRHALGSHFLDILRHHPDRGWQLLNSTGALQTLAPGLARRLPTDLFGHLTDPALLREHHLYRVPLPVILARLVADEGNGAAGALDDLTRQLHLHLVDAAALGHTHTLLRRLHTLHTRDLTRDELVRWGRGTQGDALALLTHALARTTSAHTPARERTFAFLHYQRFMRDITPPAPLIRGRDLLAAGFPAGPHLRTTLRDIRSRHLAGDIATPAEAIMFARR